MSPDARIVFARTDAGPVDVHWIVDKTVNAKGVTFSSQGKTDRVIMMIEARCNVDLDSAVFELVSPDMSPSRATVAVRGYGDVTLGEASPNVTSP